MIHEENILFSPRVITSYDPALRTRSKLTRLRPSADLNPISCAVLRDLPPGDARPVLDDREDPNVRERNRRPD